MQIGHLYPANSHLKGRSLPSAQQDAIAEAIAKDGPDQVLSGTRKFCEKSSELAINRFAVYS